LLTSPPASLRGADRPRVELRPLTEVSHSLGDFAAELSARAGLILEPWQADGVDLMMSVRPDGKWACFEYFELVARQQGKSALIEARALAGLLLLNEPEILWSAHEYKTAMTGFRRMRRYIRKLGTQIDKDGFLWDVDGIPVKINTTHGDEGFERLDTEARIKFIARSKGSGRGFSGDTIFIDEAFAYTDFMHDALLPTMLARPNGQIIYTSTPPLSGDTGEVMYDLKERAEAGGDDGLGYRDWGLGVPLEERGKVDLDDPRVWAKTCPALGRGRVTQETIRKLQRSMGELGFAREIGCLWPKRKKGGVAIDPKQWVALLDAGSKRDGDVTVGVDIAPDRSYAAIGLYGTRADGLGHLQLLNYQPGTDWIVPRMVELRRLDPLAFAMGRATFESLKAELEREGFAKPEKAEEPERGDLAVTSAAEMSAATGQMLDAVKQQKFKHIGQRELDGSVTGAKVKQLGDALVWVRKDADSDTCPVVSVTVARWGHESRAHLITNGDFDLMNSIW